jgi:hypothetical protein
LVVLLPCAIKNIIIAKYVNIEFDLKYYLISQIADLLPDWVLTVLGVSFMVI